MARNWIRRTQQGIHLFENARVCLKDDQCEFSVEVTP